MKILSPITKSENISFEKKIPVNKIINLYSKKLNVDVSRFFKNQTHIYIYKCNDTGLKFYHPNTTAGDSKFYKNLQCYEWYYMDNKWEYEKALDFIKHNMNILDIGCGKGAFLKKVSKVGAKGIGLEFSTEAVKYGKANGLNIYHDSIQDFSLKHNGIFDIVCFFQVMEHVVKPKEILEAALFTLKKNGLLIISVPNNEILMNSNMGNFLNMPPHHMLLWNTSSLMNLQKIVSLKILDIIYEPLQYYHYSNYYTGIIEPIVQFTGPFGRALRKITLPLGSKIISKLAFKLKGHSIFTAYKKI